MVGRYTAEFLLFLRQSPLCVKPPGLPPAEEWMGPPPDPSRTQSRTHKGAEGGSPEHRRSGTDRTGTRVNSGHDDIVLGPPRTTFGHFSTKPGDIENMFRDSDARDRTDRFNFRNRVNDSDGANERSRDGRNNGYRRRGEGEDEGDSRAATRPRRSFGHDGAERFHGRMGGGDRYGTRDDRRARDRDDKDAGERRSRHLDHLPEDKDGNDTETPRRNGMARGRSDPWFKEGADAASTPQQRERIDKTKNWRDRETNERAGERHGDRANNNNNNRAFDRRWDRDRDQRVEREPEWLDEPAEEKPQGHTAEDFRKFMDAMKAGRRGGQKPQEDKPAAPANSSSPEDTAILRQRVTSTPAAEFGPDKFFAAYGSALDVGTPAADTKELPKPKAAKPSRFTSFFSTQDESRGRTEPPTPAAPTPLDQSGSQAEQLPQLQQQLPQQQQQQQQQQQPRLQQDDAEKEAFQVLLQKLQRQTLGQTLQSSALPQLPQGFPERPSAAGVPHQKSNVVSPEPFQSYGPDRDDARFRPPPPPPPAQEISPRPMILPSQPPVATRPEQNLQELLAQRAQAQSQGSGRMEPNPAAVNSNTEFLMRLMQGARNAPEPPRTEQLLVRMPQPTKHVSLANVSDRDLEFLPRERSTSQRQMRAPPPQGPPVFMEQHLHSPEGDSRPQPTQILQRPPPPGLDHPIHAFPMAGAGQMPPQRPMIPPPRA